MRASRRLSPERSNDRYEEERRQGERIVAADLERVWGWSGPAGRHSNGTGATASSDVRQCQQVSEDLDVRPWLRTLGYRGDQLKCAADYCDQMAEGTLEERVKTALRLLA